MINQMVKEHTPGASIAVGVAVCLVPLIHQSLLLLMEESMKVNGRMECIMVMEHILFLMVASILGNGGMERNMVKVHSITLMEVFM